MARQEAEQQTSHGPSSRGVSPLQHDRMESAAPIQRRTHVRKQFVLCFDGTGNKFSGTDADSNILKIYRMLDRNNDDSFHYYQPGIGTYVAQTGSSTARPGRIERFKHWYAKAKDSAVGTSFDLHVMAGYRFLMRYYTPGDDIFFFGFSRGAYTARFLAEMLDHVGLLSAGNEEMCHFAWKTFQKWQCRLESNDEEKKEKKELLEFMCAFRETFSRPVRAIRFLGLFDTVNSVPHFESAWMQRSKFPYTARSSSRVIRHAVSIDERRAKFRQDLISQAKPDHAMLYKRHHRKHHKKEFLGSDETHDHSNHNGRDIQQPRGRRDTLAPPEDFRNPHETSGVRSLSPDYSCSNVSVQSTDPIHTRDSWDEDEGEQDIQEVWFPGCHADIGGGWPLDSGHEAALSHVPLVWMVREAQKAGLEFDEEKLEALHCCHEDRTFGGLKHPVVPAIAVNPASPLLADGQSNGAASTNHTVSDVVDEKNTLDHHHTHPDTSFHSKLHYAATRGRIHDVLQFNNGAAPMGVVSWNVMEYLPFRRMDLCEDGSWKAIRWPLPKGETRDIPANAHIHSSVIKRMLADPKYRPGNLIVGGGGRGVRRAPEEMGIGRWVCCCDEGHPVGECFVRKEKPVRKATEQSSHSNVMPSGPQGNYFSGRNV
ncbi:hypothetical protein C7974DRAFT_369601 [Boeremia exigua]|uniref:uncharacterized protein n=1 Tax=Boeremia exigua TaxID=749465 RepID=UPI001E8E34BA|nr:uncharacterized protein C7974DRAFT_369601 [Boeremia exigua]KAH6612650.1 hypothetical protein C7974DRAFT_369601 [Boeremia exigua]